MVKHVEHTSEFSVQVSDNPTHWISALGMMILTFTLILLNVSLIKTICKLRTTNPNKHMSKSVVCSAFTTISFAATAFSCLTTTILISISSDFYHQSVVDDIFTKMSISLYTLSQTLMIYLFIKRIDDAFHDSIIQYSKTLINALYFTSIIFVIFCVFVAIALVFEFMTIFQILLLIWMTLFLCLSTILCILFIRKTNLLLQVTDNVDKDILYMVIKQSILIPMAICTSFICYIMVVLVQYWSVSSHWIPEAIFWIVVDCAVSSIAIFLLFSFNNHFYDKCCHLLHQLCEKNKINSSQTITSCKSTLRDGNMLTISCEASYIAKTVPIDKCEADNKQIIPMTEEDENISLSQILIHIPALADIESAPVFHSTSFHGSKRPKIKSSVSLK